MSNLENFRQQIDLLDAQLIELLGRRFEVVRNVAHFKKEQGIPMMQAARIDAVKERTARLAAQYSVGPEFISALYDLIIEESCRVEDQIIENQDR